MRTLFRTILLSFSLCLLSIGGVSHAKTIYINPEKELVLQFQTEGARYVLSGDINLNGEIIVLPAKAALIFNHGVVNNGRIKGCANRIQFDSPFLGSDIVVEGCFIKEKILYSVNILAVHNYDDNSIHNLFNLAKPGTKIKIKGNGATSIQYWGVESDNFEQKENNAYNQFIKDKLSDYYELDNKWGLAYGRSFDESLTQEERDKAVQEDRELHQQLEALRKEKYNAAILDFMKDRPFCKRMIDELMMIATYDKKPAIIEKAREIFKKVPQEAMNIPLVLDTKAKLYAQKVKIGEQMKDFTLFDREGSKHQLSDFKGKYTILEFTFVGCGGCVFIKPFLEEFYKRNKDKAEVIAIYKDTKENWMKEGQEHKVSYHEWSDPTFASEPVAAYDIKAYPTFVIIDPNGKILDIKTGGDGLLKALEYIPDAEVEKKYKEALKS